MPAFDPANPNAILNSYAVAQAAADAARAEELRTLAGYAAANRYSNTYTREGNNAVQAEILAQRNRDEAKRSHAAAQEAAKAQSKRVEELRVQEANIGRLMQGRATTPWEQAQEYSAARAQYFGYGGTPANPQSSQKPNLPQPTIQMQQARDTRIPWSTRVQTYTDYLQRTQPSLNPIYARNDAIALIGPDPAAPVFVKAAPYKSPLQLAQEARVAQLARDRETQRMDEIGRAMAAAKNPAAASAAAFAQQLIAFGNAPYKPPVQQGVSATNQVSREAIANGAVLASIVDAVKKSPSSKPKGPRGNSSGSKKRLTGLKK